jgi:hypothetical protein
MQYAQYKRIETKAGGLTCTNKRFIKACYTVLSTQGKQRDSRIIRHAWLRQGLEMLSTSKAQYRRLNF